MARDYTTGEVAKLIGISQRQLYRWLHEKRLPEPRQIVVGRAKIRIWNARDVKRALDLKLAMQRGRPRKNGEPMADKRLLALDRHLAWYASNAKLTRRELVAFHRLRHGLKKRLVEKGLVW